MTVLLIGCAVGAVALFMSYRVGFAAGRERGARDARNRLYAMRAERDPKRAA